MMKIVEQINPMDACSNDEVMKNQYTGLIWADSLNNAVTRALYNRGRIVSHFNVAISKVADHIRK